MSHFNFDRFLANTSKTQSVEILGKLYSNLPDIPLALGAQIEGVFIDLTIPEKTAEAAKQYEELLPKVIDFVFGKGAYASWAKPKDPTKGMSARGLAMVLLFIRNGYDTSVMVRMAEVKNDPTPEEAPAKAKAPAIPAKDSTFENTGKSLQPTSEENTASVSGKRKRTISPGQNSSS